MPVAFAHYFALPEAEKFEDVRVADNLPAGGGFCSDICQLRQGGFVGGKAAPPAVAIADFGDGKLFGQAPGGRVGFLVVDADLADAFEFVLVGFAVLDFERGVDRDFGVILDLSFLPHADLGEPCY